MTPVPLYLSPNYEKIAAGYNQAQLAMLREFVTKGYVIIEPEIEDFDQLAGRVVGDLGERYGPSARIQDAWHQSGAVKDIALAPRITEALALLYGRNPFPFQTLNFRVGSQQRTHSDTIHFDSLPRGFMAGVWVALEDIDADNGPLRYYPGSHRLHHFDLGDLGARDVRRQSIYRLYRTVYEPAIERLVTDQQLTPEFAHLRKGQALIWAANLLHGGAPIRNPERTRHSQVTHYFFDDCAYITPMGADVLAGYGNFRRPWDIRTGKRRAGRHGGEEIGARRVLLHRMKRQAARVMGRLI